MGNNSIWVTDKDRLMRVLIGAGGGIVVALVFIFVFSGSDSPKEGAAVSSVGLGDVSNAITTNDVIAKERLGQRLSDSLSYLKQAEDEVKVLEEQLGVAKAKASQGKREVNQIQQDLDSLEK